MFNENSKMKSIFNHPIGRDITTTLIESQEINPKYIYNPVIKNLKLKHLKRLSKGLVDDNFITMLCSKLNAYEHIKVPASEPKIKPKWWKESVVYQIYPRSFYDSNGDGIGDLAGIEKKLDYLQELGIDIIWLSPIYDSPNDDNGYDIRDYQKIMAEFGTMEDFDSLLEAVHSRDMRLIMDLVVNHTSDEHQWYQEALKGKDNPYRDYYMWKESNEQGQPPNNWTSFFSGPAWNYDEASDEWALHLFSKKQMDLNWEHAPMREAVYNMIKWWLDKGIDGFRLDVINFISKEKGLPEGNPIIGELMGVTGGEHYFFGPHIHEHLAEMNAKTFAKYDTVLVGETPGTGLEMSQLFTHESRHELDMVFCFEHLDPPGKVRFDKYTYDLNYLKSNMLKWQTDYNNQCWNSLFYENHDNPRMISKVDRRKEYRVVIGKLLAMIQMTLKGTPFIFQGQELGMIDVGFNSIDQFKDIESINLYHELIEKGSAREDALAHLHNGSRDHARVPMPWSDELYGGFSTVEPWINEKDNYKTINVRHAIEDNQSVYHFYKKLIELRQQYKTLVYGEFNPVKPNVKDIFCYYRKDEEHTFYIEINLTARPHKTITKINSSALILSNYATNDTSKLHPYECRLYIVK